MSEINHQPKTSTLRKYYPTSTLSNDELTNLADWVRDYLGKKHISPDNQILRALVARYDEKED